MKFKPRQTGPGRGRLATRARGATLATGLSRAVRWIDDWTVEAFNPVYPHHRGRRR
ncbi:hypothetical protein [Goodfellowiella coeruleoviolacea]|uniref:Uncharacterized protein n=1 Tax=Goodfellowiella coeruleoviolacea TaxID=334858 RepID=A0AAE3GGN8_9PSEU|nr:hypothetical protein [Goodfellowiella coeruleoviolacea]MCP2166964.1 hypothetical protein [Goodfellowiella coeruleoviolacea]